MATIKSFKQLKAAGGVVSKEPIKRHIKWSAVNPETEESFDFDADVWIIKPASGVMIDIYSEKAREQVAALISKTVLLENDKGKLELFPYEEAYQLDNPLRDVLWEEIQKVGGLGRKNLPPMTSSSVTSSPTESAGEQSQKPESESTQTST